MKRYRLIQTYPGSPELNTTVIGQDCNYFRYEIENTPVTQPSIAKSDIENHPNFWEDITANYEILSLEYSSELYTNFRSKLFKSMLINLVNDSEIKIHSIKRLSDNKIFTIGDEVCEFFNAVGYTKPFKIDNIYLQTPTMVRLNSHPYDNQGCTHLFNKVVLLEDACEFIKPEPFFTTEDGVEIDNHTEVWYLKNDNKYSPINTVVFTNSSKKTGHLYFSTKKAIENYILMNKPCLCINDIINFKGSKDSNFMQIYLKDIVKAKL